MVGEARAGNKPLVSLGEGFSEKLCRLIGHPC